ncbi:MAG: adenine deaminase [Romboutsia sp.]
MDRLQQLCKASSGEIKSTVVLKNANIINVFTEEIIKGDVAILGDTIVGVGNYEGEKEIDCSEKYICPGFIDAHIHIESTMVTPLELSKMILKSGTTTIIADPHELVNVKGSKAIEFLLDSTENIPLNIYLMLPSSVPATKFETNGSDFDAQDIKKFINHPRVLGLGEVMCFNDVVNGEEGILTKLSYSKDKIADGHAPNIRGKRLQSYACCGVETDHECITYEEAYEKIQAGLKILIREGSAAKNLESIVLGLLESNIPLDNFMFCTDDKHLDDIEREGHIRWNIKRAIDLGMEPIKAIKMATYNSAKTYGLKRLGAIAPGYKADIVILDNIDSISVNSVYKDGFLVEENIFKEYERDIKDTEMLKTVNFKEFTIDKLKLKVEEKNYIIESIPYQILTNKLYEKLPEENGYFKPNETYSKICVVERHKQTGNIVVAPFKGFGIKNGAIATTVAHDSHNIIAVGDNDEDIFLAIKHLKEIQGGYVIASNGEVVGELQLEIAGLMSRLSSEKVQEITSNMINIARKMGVPKHIDPFITLSFMALPVIPQVRITDLGLFDVDLFKLI